MANSTDDARFLKGLRPKGGPSRQGMTTGQDHTLKTTVAQPKYRPGIEKKQRVLEAGLNAFVREGFDAAGTREIAQAAGVNLPAIQYYFGGKEGLYLACAEMIVDRFRSYAAPAAAIAAKALDTGCDEAQAKASLRAFLASTAQILVGHEATKEWAPFIAYELSRPGPAFELFHDRVWRPGVDLTARLIARSAGLKDVDEPSRLRALIILSSFVALRNGRQVSLRTMGWPTLGPDQISEIIDVLTS